MTPEEREIRRTALGASDIAGALGLSPWTTPWEVWAEKSGLLEPWEGNDATQEGHELEPTVLNRAERLLGALDRNIRILAPDGLPLAATLDGRVAATRRPVEAKTTGIVGPVVGDWGDALTDQVPSHYLVQVHAQLICTGADLAYLFALIAGRGIVEYHIEPCDQLHAWLKERATQWWNDHVVAGVPPQHGPPPKLQTVKRLKLTAGKHIEAPENSLLAVSFWLDAKEAESGAAKANREAKAIRDAAEAGLLMEMKDAETMLLPDGRVVRREVRNRKGYTVEPSASKALVIEEP